MIQSQRIPSYIQWMLDAIDKIQGYAGYDEIGFVTNYVVIDACLMQLIHIGELMYKIRKLNPDFHLHDDIPLQRVIDFRNFAAHDYLGINVTMVRKIVFDHLPLLREALQHTSSNE